MHPVELNRYTIPTEPLEEWVNYVVLVANSNIPGAITYGAQRSGKTFAQRHFVRHFRDWLKNDIGVISVEARPHKIASESGFFGDMLDTMGCPTTKRRPAELRKLFVGRLLEAAAGSEQRKVVCLLDEGQLMDGFTLSLLASVHNDLVRYGTRCTWILVGQPELKTLQDTLALSGARQLVARFMRASFEFKAVERGLNFAACVGYFDRAKFPKDGPTFTGHFAPAAVRTGYLIQEDAPMIEATLMGELALHAITPKTSLTIEGFIEVMNHILMYQLPKILVGGRLTPEMVRESARSTTWLSIESNEALLS